MERLTLTQKFSAVNWLVEHDILDDFDPMDEIRHLIRNHGNANLSSEFVADALWEFNRLWDRDLGFKKVVATTSGEADELGDPLFEGARLESIDYQLKDGEVVWTYASYAEGHDEYFKWAAKEEYDIAHKLAHGQLT